MRVMQSKFTKTNPPKNFQTGGRARRAGPWSAFAQTQRILPRREPTPQFLNSWIRHWVRVEQFIEADAKYRLSRQLN